MKSGDVFERVTVIAGPWKELKGGQFRELCRYRCICGAERITRTELLLKGVTKSCGCLGRERAHAAATKHGCARKVRRPEYGAWAAMKDRCNTSKPRVRADYADRGIYVCSEWRHSFEAFFHDVGPRPSADHTLDRIDNNRGYEPGNVRWATRKTQQRNTRRTKFLTYEGITKSLSEWAEDLGISASKIHNRLRDGWPPREALSKQKLGHIRNFRAEMPARSPIADFEAEGE